MHRSIRRTALACALLLTLGSLAPRLAAQDADPAGEASTQSAKERLDALIATYQEEMQAFQMGFAALETDEQRREHYENNFPKPGETATALLDLARESRDEVGFEAIEWILSNRVQGDAKREAISFFTEHFVADPRTGDILWNFAYELDPAVESLLEGVIAKSPEKNARGIAHYSLAQYLLGRVEFSRYVEGATAEERASLITFVGEENMSAFEGIDLAAIEARVLTLFEKVQSDFADVPARRSSTLGATVARDIFALKNLSIGKPAPEIEGEDLFGTSFKLSDYRGKVIFLDFWGDW